MVVVVVGLPLLCQVQLAGHGAGCYCGRVNTKAVELLSFLSLLGARHPSHSVR